jgi:hypothetical protein
MTLKIYDGANSDLVADLDNGTTAAIRRSGWQQRGPQPLPGDLWEDVEETVVVSLLTADNSIYSTLMALARRAEEVQSPTHKDHLNPAAWVIAEAKTPDEHWPRWALVKEIRVEKLDPAHYRANGRLALEVKFIREGTWRGEEPGQEPRLLYSAATSFLTPIDVDLRNANLGDAPPLTTFALQSFCSNDAALVRFEAWAGETPPAFAPYLWVNDIDATPSSTILISSLSSPFSTTTLPGGRCVALGTTGGQHLWNILLNDYTGAFDVYGLYQKGATGTATTKLLHGWQNSPDYEEGELINVPITTLTTGWYILPLGTVKMPARGEWIYGQPPAASTGMGSYRIGVYGYSSVAGQAYFGGLLIVPQPDYPAQTVNTFGGGALGNLTTVVNAEINRVYWLNDSGLIVGANGEPADGPYQTLVPGYMNRLHFIPLPRVTSAEAQRLPPIATAWDVDISAIPRWQYLNQLPAEPAVTIHSGPPSLADDNAEFTFTADRSGCTFACRLDDGVWGACTSPHIYAGLAEGYHEWQVRATSNGVTGEAVTYGWTVYEGGPI